MRNRFMICRSRPFFYRGALLLLLLLFGFFPRFLSAQKLYLFCEGGYYDETDTDSWSNFTPNKAVSDMICRFCDPSYLVPYNNRDGEDFGGEWTGPDIGQSENVCGDIFEAIESCPAGEDDTIFFYWTGRGGRDDKGDYLLMPEGKGEPTMYRAEILDALRKKNPRLIVFMTDCCSTWLPSVCIDPAWGYVTVRFQDLLTEGAPWLYANLFFRFSGVLDLDVSSPPDQDTDLNRWLPNGEYGCVGGMTPFARVVSDILENKRLEPYDWKTFVQQINSDRLSRIFHQKVQVREYPEQLPSYSIEDSAICRTGMWEIREIRPNKEGDIEEKVFYQPYQGKNNTAAPSILSCSPRCRSGRR